MHIVYVCSPDWENYLFASLRSIFASATVFEQVTIYCVGSRPRSWQFGDDRIIVEETPDIGDGFWLLNKIHLCRAESNDVVYLDADTIVLKPLNVLLKDTTGEVAGRLASAALKACWDEERWKTYLRQFGAEAFFPYLNTGVLVFRNGAHRRLAEPWLDITKAVRATDPYSYSKKHAGQHAFAFACGALRLSYSLLSPMHHAYGWQREPYGDAVVFHTGGRSFFKYARRINRETGVLNADSPIPNPSLR